MQEEENEVKEGEEGKEGKEGEEGEEGEEDAAEEEAIQSPRPTCMVCLVLQARPQHVVRGSTAQMLPNPYPGVPGCFPPLLTPANRFGVRLWYGIHVVRLRIG